jgi:integrase
MPRRKKGIRLGLRPSRRDGNNVRRASWIILDGHKHIATGCAASEIAAAEAKLAEYVAAKYQPARKARDIEQIDVADVLAIYEEDCRDRQANHSKFYGRLGRLNDFWGGRKLSEVTGQSCRDYIADRGSSGGARRDLEDLRAAINHHAKEGLHRGIVRVLLPARGAPRTRWLTRSEAARLIWVCWRTRERQKRHRGSDKDKTLPTDRKPLLHLARFILIGLYSGSRAAAIAAASPHKGVGRSYVDLENGIFYRLPEGQTETRKRQPPVPIPPRLLAHLRRWVDKGLVGGHFVQWHGSGVRSVKTAFRTAVSLADLSGKVTPHTLRHTAATWLMQAGVDKWEAAGFLGMSVEMLDRVYGHHHPDHLRTAARALGYGRRRQSLAETLAGRRGRRRPSPQRVESAGGPGRTRTSNQTVMSGGGRTRFGRLLNRCAVHVAQCRESWTLWSRYEPTPLLAGTLPGHQLNSLCVNY